MKQKDLIFGFLLSVVVGLFLSLVAMRTAFFEPGVISYRDFSGSADYLGLAKEALHSWHDGVLFGHSTIQYPVVAGSISRFAVPPATSVFYLYGLLGLVNFGGYWGSRLFLLGAFWLAFIGMAALSAWWFKDRQGSFRWLGILVASLIYGVNPVISGRAWAGHAGALSGYGLFALLVLAYLIIRESNPKKTNFQLAFLGGSLLLATTTQINPQYTIIYGMLIGLDLLVSLFSRSGRQSFLKKTVAGLGMLFLSLLINLPVFLPSAIFPEHSIMPPQTIGSLSQYVFGSQATSLTNLLTLASRGAWLAIFGQEAIPAEIFRARWAYPRLALFGLIVGLKQKKLRFLFLASLFALFLAKGAHEPWTDFSIWLFENTFLLKPLRDTSRFNVLILVFYAISTGVLFNWLGSWKLKKNWLVWARGGVMVGCFGLMINWLVIVNPDYFSGDLAGSLAWLNSPTSFGKLDKNLSSQNEGRFLYLPVQPSLSARSWPSAKVSDTSYGGNPFLIYHPLEAPLANSFSVFPDTWSARLAGYWENHFANLPVTELMLAKTNTRWVGFEEALTTDSPAFETKELLKKGAIDSGLFDQRQVGGEFAVFEAIEPSSLILLANKAWFLVGDFNLIPHLPGLLESEASLPWLFLNQQKKEMLTDLPSQSAPLLFYNRDLVDLEAFFWQKREIDLMTATGSAYEPALGWISWEPHLAGWIYKDGLDFGSGLSVGTQGAGAKLILDFKIEEAGKQVLYLRPFLQPAGGLVELRIDGQPFDQVDFSTSGYQGLKWQKFETFELAKGKHQLELVSLANRLAVIDGARLVPIQEQVQANELWVEREKLFVYTKDFLDWANKEVSLKEEFETESWRQASFSQAKNFELSEAGAGLGKVVGTSAPATGVYELVFKVNEDRPLAGVEMFWDTSFLGPDRIGRFLVSRDTETWLPVGSDQVSDGHPFVFYDEHLVKGWGEVYLKYQIEDKSEAIGTFISSLGYSARFMEMELSLSLPQRELVVWAGEKMIGSVEGGANSVLVDGRLDLSDPETIYLFGNKKELLEPLSKEVAVPIFQEVSPARYEVEFSLDQPAFLVFSESFSQQWRLGNNKPFPINYYANGFYLPAGEHDFILKHRPDFFYRICLMISLVVIMAILAYILWLLLTKKRSS